MISNKKITIKRVRIKFERWKKFRGIKLKKYTNFIIYSR